MWQCLRKLSSSKSAMMVGLLRYTDKIFGGRRNTVWMHAIEPIEFCLPPYVRGFTEAGSVMSSSTAASSLLRRSRLDRLMNWGTWGKIGTGFGEGVAYLKHQ